MNHLKFEDESGYTNQYSSNIYKSSGESKTTMLRFTPALRLNIPAGNTIIFSRFGPTIGIMGKMNYSGSSSTSYTDLQTNTTDYSSSSYAGVYTGGLSFGMFGSVGLNYKMSDSFGFFAEVSATAQSWAPAHRERTKDIYDGQDLLAGASVSQIETNYVSEMNSSDPASPSEPEKQLKFHYPMSSLGFNVGIQILLNK